MKTEDLLLVCGNTARGKNAFGEVVFLALRTRIKLNSIAQKAIGAELSVLELLKEEENRVIADFNSLRSDILKEFGADAVEVGNQLTVDELCNSAV